MKRLIRRFAIWILRKTGDVQFTFTIACKCGSFFQVYLPDGCNFMSIALGGRIEGTKPEVEKLQNVRGLRGNGGHDLRN